MSITVNMIEGVLQLHLIEAQIKISENGPGLDSWLVAKAAIENDLATLKRLVHRVESHRLKVRGF